MSGVSFSYTRAKRERDAKPHEVDIDGQRFTLKSRMGTMALDAIGRARTGDPSALPNLLRALMATEDDYRRFVELDLDSDDELPAVIEGFMGLYGDPGESEGSSTSSNADGPSSTPTGNGSTDETSPTTSSETPSLSAASAT